MKTKQITYTAVFAALISISAIFRVPLGPVPITLQSTCVLITGYCIGSKYGSLSVIIYIMLGLAGIPVFTGGGGPAYILSPTFGYIIGFLFCAAMTGLLQKIIKTERFLLVYLIMLICLSGIYIPGLIWLMVSLRCIADVPASYDTILKAGFLVPALTDILKTIPAAIIAPKLRKILT